MSNTEGSRNVMPITDYVREPKRGLICNRLGKNIVEILSEWIPDIVAGRTDNQEYDFM